MSFAFSKSNSTGLTCSTTTVFHESTIWCNQISPLTTGKVALQQWQSKAYQPYIELAVDILKTCKFSAIQSLKDFLSCLPSPTITEAVLADALYQLADVDRDACGWLLRHPRCLMPELDVIELAHNRAQLQLQAQGFVYGEDFYLAQEGQLITDSPQVKAALLESPSNLDILLMAEIWQIDDEEKT